MKRISLNWKLSAFSIFFLVVFTYLGFWQLERGAQKTVAIKEDKQRRLQPGISLNRLLKEAAGLRQLNGQPVLLQGSFEDDVLFLLDNRVLQGKVGFEVLVPFRDRSGQIALINRGFVPMGRTRSDIPEIPAIKQTDKPMAGNIYIPYDFGSGNRRIMQAIEKLGSGALNEQTIYLVQSLETEIIAEVLQQNLFPHIIRLAERSPNALPRHWPFVTMPPERHYGYAMTWFLMAVTVAIAFVVFTIRSNTEYPEDD